MGIDVAADPEPAVAVDEKPAEQKRAKRRPAGNGAAAGLDSRRVVSADNVQSFPAAQKPEGSVDEPHSTVSAVAVAPSATPTGSLADQLGASMMLPGGVFSSPARSQEGLFARVELTSPNGKSKKKPSKATQTACKDFNDILEDSKSLGGDAAKVEEMCQKLQLWKEGLESGVFDSLRMAAIRERYLEVMDQYSNKQASKAVTLAP